MSLPIDKSNSFAGRHDSSGRRLLIPVKNAEGATRAISYAIRRRAEGLPIRVFLLHVEETFPARLPIAGDRSQVSEAGESEGIFTELMHMLEGLDIEVSAYVRYGPLVFSILDAAEELDCDEIVVPAPHKGPFRILSHDVVANLLAQQRSVHVVAVSKNGMSHGASKRRS